MLLTVPPPLNRGRCSGRQHRRQNPFRDIVQEQRTIFCLLMVVVAVALMPRGGALVTVLAAVMMLDR